MSDLLFSDPTSCRVVTADVSVHWFTSFEAGAPCRCGKTTYKPEPLDDAAAHASSSAAQDSQDRG